MWLPDTKHTIWNMKTEKEAEFLFQNQIVSLINQNIDFNNWLANYCSYYQKWLNEDDQTIFDLRSPLLKSILDAIQNVNKKMDDNKRLFYWFDIDRSFKEDYRWKNCPITKTKLINLGQNFFYANRLISQKVDLVLPDNQE